MEVWLNGKEASPNLDALANTEVKRNTDMMQNINQENIKERKDTVDVTKKHRKPKLPPVLPEYYPKKKRKNIPT